MAASDRYRVEPLGPHHDRAAFSCGEPDLDRYLRTMARQGQSRGLAAVFVLHDPAERAVVGYYTLSALQVEPTGLPESTAKRLPRRPAPATLLGRLAVDARHQGQGLGERLLIDALFRARAASDQVGSLAVVVDAKNERARAFYERYGFQRFADDPFRLFLPMGTVRHLAEAAPNYSTPDS